MRKIVKYLAAALLLLVLTIGGYVLHTLWRHEVFVAPTYDMSAPPLPELGDGPSVLVFSKTNSFRHVDAIPAANTMFQEFADELKWSIHFTENAAVHSSELLKRYDLVVWSNVSGDVLTEDQRVAFQAYLEGGGKVLGIHGTGGSPLYEWEWYPKEFIRAQFIAHPAVPQFQDAALEIEDTAHPAMKHLPERWDFHDEWYSFQASPRERVHVLATLDEDSYRPSLAGPFGDLRMGDHPIIWHHKVGEGTVFYSALGHKAEAYADDPHREMLKQACVWLLAGAKSD